MKKGGLSLSALSAGVKVSLRAAFSGSKKLKSDLVCKNPNTPGVMLTTLVSAQKAFREADARLRGGYSSKQPFEDETYQCFCQQQLQMDSTFQFPPFYGAYLKLNGFFFFKPVELKLAIFVEKKKKKLSGTPEKDLCSPWLSKKFSERVFAIIGVISVLLINQILKVTMEYFVIWESHYFVTDVITSQMSKLFATQFLNTAIIILLVNADFHGFFDWLPKEMAIGRGDYDDFTTDWFLLIGVGLMSTVSLQAFQCTIPSMVIGLVQIPIMRLWYGPSRRTQETLNDIYENPEWNLSLRMAETMTVFFCAVFYASGMPMMWWFAAGYCLIGYWGDKILLLRGAKIPPSYNETGITYLMKLVSEATKYSC